MDKNKREKELLWRISMDKNAEGNCFTMPESSAESYFIERTEQNAMMEYAFQTVPELIQLLRQRVPSANSEELIRILAIAAFKNRPIMTENDNCGEQPDIADKDTLPAHIYNM